MSSLVRFSMAALLAGLSPFVGAQGFEAVRLAPLPPGQDGGRLGAFFIAGTAYRGSDERRNLLLPAIDYQWSNGWFAGVGNGLGYNASPSPELQYGPRLTVDLGRDEGRSEALRGMGSIDTQPELGVFFNRLWGPRLAFTSSLRQGAGTQRRGLVLDLGTSYGVPLGMQTRLSLGLGAHWANADYMQDYFGVTPAQSATSGYAVASPGAGWRNVGMNVSLSRRLDKETSVFAGIAFNQLLGDARESALTRRSAALTGVVGLAYAF
ncbi:MAG: MipA/OmpV family protein [Hylemonella sp.]|nr:MipA/OmpV family protein [Hylemonella sp.]